MDLWLVDGGLGSGEAFDAMIGVESAPGLD